MEQNAGEASQLRQPTIAVPVRLAIVAGDVVDAELFIPDTVRTGRTQLLEDLATHLEDDSKFVPVRVAGDVQLLAKRAIAWVREHQPSASRLVIFGDGVITAGAKLDEISASLRQKSNLQRIDFVLSGGLRDDAVATRLVRTGQRPGVVVDTDGGIDNVVAALGERMLTDVAIDVRGASWVYPRSIPSARPGSRVMVYARMPAPQDKHDVGINKHRRSVAVVATR